MENEEIELITTKFSSVKYPEFTLILTQEKQAGMYFSFRYCVFWHPKIGGKEHIVQNGSGSSNVNNHPITDDEKFDLLERSVNGLRRGVWKRA